MALVGSPKSQRSQARALAQGDGSEVDEPSRPGSQSSDDDQVTKLAVEMQREVLLRSGLS